MIKQTIGDMYCDVEWNERLTVVRKLKRFSTRDAAAAASVSPKSWWCWEHGETYPSKLSRVAIARTLNVDEKVIFWETDIRPNPCK